MQAIWVLAVLAMATADVSHLGYHYKVPQTSYQVGGSNGQFHSGLGNLGHGINYKGAEGQYLGSSFSHGDHGVPSHFTGDAQLSASSLNGGSFSGYSSGLNNGYSSGLSSGLGGGSGLSSGQYYQTTGGPSTVQPIYLGGSNQYQTTQYQSNEKYQQFYQVQSNEPAQVYKHFYVHSAPEEIEPPKPRTPIVVPPPQKHYKIIFVKTPSVQSHSSQVVQVQPQNEEKTIVYVLVKKPEEHREIITPKVEQKPPTKPEVYFIKYNDKEDSQAVINNIVSDYSNKPGQSVSYTTGGSEGSSVLSGLPSSGSSFTSGSSSFSDVPSSGFSTIPSGGFSSGFSKYPSSSSFSNIPDGSTIGSTFSSSPSSVGTTFSGVPTSFSTGSSGPSSFSTGTSSSGIPVSLSTGSTFPSYPSNNIFNQLGSSSGSNSGISSGSGLSTLFGTSQSDSSESAPAVSFPASSQSFGVSTSEANDFSNDAGAEASSVFSGVSSSTQDNLNKASGTQGLPHETYGVPKFRIN